MNGNPVDNAIVAADGNWTFNEQVAAHFDSHVRKSIPGYDKIQAIVVELAERFLCDGGVMYDLGTATGETVAQLQQRNRCGPDTRFVGVDNSLAMLERARDKCDAANAEFHYADVAEMTAFPEARLVVCVCTLQFIPVEHRAPVLRAAQSAIETGGAFLLVEKIRAESDDVQRTWDETLHAHKRSQGLSDAMIRQKAKSLVGVLVPLTLEQNAAMLRDAGFTPVETVFLWDGFAGLLAHQRGAG